MAFRQEQSGFTIVWTAVVLFFIMGAASLAVDASGFMEDARFEQTVADLSCLAGVKHLPGDPDSAHAFADEFAGLNWDTIAAAPAVRAGNVTTIADAEGNQVVITAPYNGESTKMQVEVYKQSPAFFGKVLGMQQQQVYQVAWCKVLGWNPGTLPFGDLPGGMDGWLQNPSACGKDAGNCQRLRIERIPKTGSNKTVAQNIAYGTQRTLVVYPGAGGATCTGITAAPTCDTIGTSTGNNDPQNTTGFLLGGLYGVGVGDGRLQGGGENSINTWMFGGNTEDGDTIDDVATLGGMGKPVSYDVRINGPWGPNKIITSLHCDTSRIIRIPILVQASEYDEWLADKSFEATWPKGSSVEMRIVGFQWGFLTDPDEAADVPGPQLTRISAFPVQFHPDLTCVGSGGDTKPYEPGDAKIIRLVSANG